MLQGHLPLRAAILAAACATLLALALAAPQTARADIPASLRAACTAKDAADDSTANGSKLPFHFCDDGVPDSGGKTPNPTGAKAVEVPQNYGGNHAGLPAKTAAQPNTGADPDGNIALDVDLSFPDPTANTMPASGYPLVVLMHGCCSGNKTGWEADTIDEPDSSEKWHYSNAWFASRGYVVMTYTARGFVNGKGDGSTGVTQIDDRRFEINDLQHLAGQLADTTFTVAGKSIKVDPKRIVATGGSYGGGFSWMALTDPTWRSPGGKELRLAAVAPRYGWTDLAYSLVPTGRHDRDELPATDGSDSLKPYGFPKQSIVAALYGSGTTGIPPGSPHATFPEAIDQAFHCTQTLYDPVEQNPLCATAINTILPSFVADRSAYYQQAYFDRLRDGDPTARVPIYSAGTLTDPLFTSVEHRRMVDRILSVDPDYPVQEHYGDYQHFAQNKRKEWSDLCGAEHEVCGYASYPSGDLDARPTQLERVGINTRLNRFVDHYVKPPSNPTQPKPAQTVTAALQVCPENATREYPLDEPGPRFTASSFDALAPHALRLDFRSAQTTTSKAAPNQHALAADPVGNQVTNDAECARANGPAGAGVATYTSRSLERRYTMIGRTRVEVAHTGTGSGLQLNARLYDVLPDGTAVMVDRGVRRVASPNGTTTFDLHGNGWRFEPRHRIRIELMQDDAPFIKASSQPSSLRLSRVQLSVPVRERAQTAGGGDGDDNGDQTGNDDDSGGGSGGDRDDNDTSGEESGSRQTDPSADDGGSLPFTGLAVLGLVAAGLGFAFTGAALRRRTRR